FSSRRRHTRWLSDWSSDVCSSDLTIAALIVAQDWRQVHTQSAGWLLVSTVFGIPLGLMLLMNPHQRMVKLILALVILFFAIYSLALAEAAHLKSDSKPWLLTCGFFAGILGGAYGMNGPPLVIYGTLRGWSPQHFRATLQGYFLPASLAGLGGYWLANLWTPVVTRHYLVSLPAVAVAIVLGRAVNRRLSGPAFLRYVHEGLI